MDILNLIKNKEDIIKFLLETIQSSEKITVGLRGAMTNHTEEWKIKRLSEVVSNQCIQIKHLSILLLIYVQSSDFDSNVTKMMVKMGRGEEALQEMIKNKFK